MTIMTTATERYEKTWNDYLELLNKNPNASLSSLTRRQRVYHRGMTRWMSRNGLSVNEAKSRIRECQRRAAYEPVSCDTGLMFLPVSSDGMPSGASRPEADMLSGISLTFPDGTVVSIRRGGAKALVSFLALYRKGGEPCLG